jgi:hypothetical protein
MNLNDIRKQGMTAAKTKARVAAERMDWSVRQFEKAGLFSISLIRGYAEASVYIDRKDYVLLGQLGDDYLIGKLKLKQNKNDEKR